MSLNKNDIKVLSVKDEFVEDGTKYAEKSWVYTFNRMGKADIYERMRNIVKGIIPQSGIEYLLKKNIIKYETKDRKRWFEINRYDIFVEGRKYDIKANFIDTRRPEFSTLSPSNLEPLLDCSALVPTDQLHSRSMSDKDIYIFCFITGRTNDLYGYNPKEALVRRLNQIDGKWILHGFWEYVFIKPPKWIQQYGKKKLGRISLRSLSKHDDGKEFLIGGTIEEKKFLTEKITLDKQKASTENEFFQLFFIRSLDGLIPDGEIILNSKFGAKETIKPRGGFNIQRVKGEFQLIQNDWNDIWFYDATIYIVGYMTKEEFERKSKEIKRFDKTVKQFEPKTDNNRLYVYDLHPIGEIL